MISIVHHILLELRKKYDDNTQKISVNPKFSDAWKEKLKKNTTKYIKYLNYLIQYRKSLKIFAIINETKFCYHN